MEKLTGIDLNLKVVDDEKIKYECDNCMDREWVVVNRLASRCYCFQNRIHKIIDDKTGKHLVKEYNDLQKSLVKKMKLEGKSSCWFFNDSGGGKSALLNYWIKRRNVNTLLIAGVEFVDEFLYQNDNGDWIKPKNDYSKYLVIAIDDIDKQWPFTDSAQNLVYRFMDEISRRDEQKLLITSNITIDKFCSIWPENKKIPLIRRLTQKCATL